jgi:hypothetical protein
MNRYIKAVFFAIPPILFLVVIPRLLLGLIPQTFQNTLAQYTNIDVASFVTGLNIIGIALAVLSAIQSWAYKWSIIKPVSSSLHVIVSFVLMLYFIGLGNPSTLGVTNLSYLSSGAGAKLNITLSLTLTLLTVMVGAAVVLKIFQKTLKWREDVGFHRLDLQADAQASQPVSIGPNPRPV